MDLLQLYEKINSQNSILLHSSRYSEKERYSIIATTPFLIFESKNDTIKINNKIKIGTPFDKLQELLETYKKQRSENTLKDGLAIGYTSYEAVHFIENLPKKKDDLKIPDMKFCFYKDYFIFDHIKNELIEVGTPKQPKTKKEIKKGKTTKLKSNFTKNNYIKTIKKVQEYIKAGDTFQVNLSQRFEMETTKDPFEIYKKLAKINPSGFGAYLNFEELKILCSSPERLIKLNGRKAWTRPIAGTRPRGKTEKQDKELEEELRTNQKELAEHTMLVDLERNDLGKVCEYGSVKIDEKMIVEKYSHVMHLVSEVSGMLRKDKTNVDLLKAMFPGGTITGCPKVRTMEIINELEPNPRGLYTGALGYFTLSGDMDFNMIIRTIVIKGTKAYAQVGGGIVYDSIPEKEYQETINKGKALFEALEVEI